MKDQGKSKQELLKLKQRVQERTAELAKANRNLYIFRRFIEQRGHRGLTLTANRGVEVCRG